MDASTEAVCYLCLDGEVNENSQPLRRDCACRGADAGFVHLSCLAKYAAAKSKQARDTNAFRDPWIVCPGCHQYYQNELAVDIANEFVPFARRQYPDNTQMKVEALHLKLCALDSMFNMLTPVQMIELGVTANVLLSLIDRMKNDAPLTRRYSEFESYAYNVHGRIALNEGSEESARRAVAHFEKALEINEAIGKHGVAIGKSNIAIAKSIVEGSNNSNIEEVLKANEELYEVRVAELGEESGYTIRAGEIYAFHLRKANRGDEARDLLTKLLAKSKQVLGLHHNTTKSVEAALEKCR